MKTLLLEVNKSLGDGIAVGIGRSGLALDWVQDGQQAETALALFG